jgi:hypothetical protein
LCQESLHTENLIDADEEFDESCDEYADQPRQKANFENSGNNKIIAKIEMALVVVDSQQDE